MSIHDGIKEISKNRMVTDLGMLVDMVVHRLGSLSDLDAEVIAKRIVAYVCKHEMEGGELSPAVMGQIYETVNDICHGGVIIPERYES